MKIVTWNCNLNLEKKFDLLQSLTPDIAIIQECEKLKENHFSNCKYFWCGENEKKGLGILVFNRSAKLDNIHNDKLIYFLPVIADDIKILGVWAYNHRAIKFGDNCSGYTSDAINHYSNWLSFNEKIIISGDFNNSVIWDKGKDNDFKNINKSFEKLGLKSSYHQHFNEEFGKETQGTLFHTKNREKPYHIDYCYYKNFKLEKVQLENFDDWITHSDHLPLIVDFEK
jgi:exonuclease III